VELGSTADVWKAHVVRGILASYDIDVVLWHEHAVYLYVPGWGARCLVLVREDDVDDAREILRTAPDAAPEAEAARTSEVTTSIAIYPDFLALVITGVSIALSVCFCELMLHYVISFLESGSIPPDPRTLAFVPGILLRLALAGAAWGVLVFVMLLLFRLVPELVKVTVGVLGMVILVL
jgi:hypothetical protein